MMRPVQQTAATVLGWLDAGRDFAAGTLVAVDGSSPLDVGASVYIAADGTIEGSVTGGCVESAVAQEALAMLEQDLPPKLVTYGISDELAGTVGLMCGGIVHIFIHPIREAAREPLRAGAGGDPRRAPGRAGHAARRPGRRARSSRRRTGLARLARRRRRCSTRNAAQEARGLTIQGRSTVREFGADGASLGSGLRVHVAAIAEPPQMVIFGAIDFASALAPLAKGLGYRVTIADPRRAFLESPRFSSNARTIAAWPGKALEGMTLGPRDAVLVFTHDPKLDVPAVEAALATDAGYVGALGSRRTTDDRNERLRGAGVSDAALARLHAPCGLDIGSSTVEETAVAILAEIIADRTGRAGRALRETSGPIRRERAEAGAVTSP